MANFDRLQNVLLVSDFANVNGGQAKVAVDSARLLAEAGINVTFFAGAGEPDASLNHPKIRLVELGQCDILSDPNRLRALGRGIWNREAAQALRNEVAQYDPACTLLHGHGYAKVLSPSIGPVFANGPLRAVYTMHEYFLACPNGGFYDYQKGEICRRHALGVDFHPELTREVARFPLRTDPCDRPPERTERRGQWSDPHGNTKCHTEDGAAPAVAYP